MRIAAETVEDDAGSGPAAHAEADSPVEVANPFRTESEEPILLTNDPTDSPVDAAAYVPQRSRWNPQQANYQTSPFADDPTSNSPPRSGEGPADGLPAPDSPKDPCAIAAFKPLGELGISITQPTGQMPTDQATPCWDQINQNVGPCTTNRCWPVLCYHWDATCLCHRPLYFEEINLERYGYSCGENCCFPYECYLQPFASAAHFFLTVPALPYCMANECPGECVYTLGHYRPGNCVPRQCHWPPFDPVAALAEGGVWTGLVFLIP